MPGRVDRLTTLINRATEDRTISRDEVREMITEAGRSRTSANRFPVNP